MTKKKPGKYKGKSKPKTDGFDRTLKITRVKLKLQALSFLKIGSGLESYSSSSKNIDKQQVENASFDVLSRLARIRKMDSVSLLHGDGDNFIIPGSTLKGLSRSRYELYDYPRKCFVVFDNKLDSKAKRYHQLFKITNQDFKTKLNYNCKICNLYGSTKNGPKISISDAKLIFSKNKSVDDFVEVVNINPFEKGSVKNFHQIYRPGSVFFFNIEMRDLNETQEAKVLESYGAITGNRRLLGFSKMRKQDIGGKDEQLGHVSISIFDVNTYKANSFGILKREKFHNLEKPSKEELREKKKEYIEKFKKMWQQRIDQSDFQSQDEVI